MNYDPHQQIGHSFQVENNVENNVASEPTVLLPPAECGIAAGLFTSANTGYLPEPMQPMRWQLPDERRLSVVRGGLRRDWRASGQVLGGLLLIGLLVLTLAHWPVHAHQEAQPKPITAPMSAASPVTAPYTFTNKRTGTPFSYHPISQPYQSGSAYRHLRLPVPGLPDAYITQSAHFNGTNRVQEGYYTVPPAAPTGIGPSVPHYSY